MILKKKTKIFQDEKVRRRATDIEQLPRDKGGVTMLENPLNGEITLVQGTQNRRLDEKAHYCLALIWRTTWVKKSFSANAKFTLKPIKGQKRSLLKCAFPTNKDLFLVFN